jgi:predicted nucleic acid-binding protein
MSTFVDTSALYAILDANDKKHAQAREVWSALADRMAQVTSTNYVLLETTALLQHRLGMNAVRALQQEIVPVLLVHWINDEDHDTAVAALLTAGRRRLSLVDCTSFGVMRQLGIRQAFAFDQHFAEQGFECVP